MTAAKGNVGRDDKLERVERLHNLASRVDSPVDRALVQAVAAELSDLRDTEKHSAYRGEIHRLRTLVIATADGLALVESALVAVCQDATDDNLDQRCALMELRTLIANLQASGRAVLDA